MGNFSTSIAIISDEYDSVASFLKKKKRVAFITKPKNGIIYLYDEKCDQNYNQIKQLSKKISSEFKCLALAFNNHDDDALCYWLFDCGNEKDQYESAPGYFKSGKIKAPRGGDPEMSCKLFNCNEGADKLRGILAKKIADEKPYNFEHERHRDICAVLGIDFNFSGLNFKIADGGGVEKLAEIEMIGDTPVTQFKRNLRKAEEKKEILKSDGVLLEEIIDKSGFYSQPIWTFCKKTGRLYFCYVYYMPDKECELFYIEPGNMHVKKDGVIKITSTIHELAIDESGKYLVAGHAAGNWKTDIFDMENGNLISSLKNSTLTNSILFNKELTRLYCLSDSLTCVSIPDLKVINKVSSFRTFPTCMGLHPSGHYAILGCQNHVEIIDLRTFKTHSRLSIGEIKDLDAKPYSDYVAAIKYVTAELGDERDFFLMQTRTFTTTPFAFKFTPDGKWLYLAGSKGLWIYDWDELLVTDSDTPDPIKVYTFLEVIKDEIREYDIVAIIGIIQRYYAYDTCYDDERNLILYSNINGLVCYVDMNKNEHGKLYKAPGNPAIIKLAWSPDKRRLVCSTNFISVTGPKIPASIQILNYQELLKKVNIGEKNKEEGRES
jgi:hypothetical protein